MTEPGAYLLSTARMADQRALGIYLSLLGPWGWCLSSQNNTSVAASHWRG